MALCLLFAQIVTSAYACPQLGKPLSSMHGAEVAAMVNCDGMSAGQMDHELPGLCKAHCEAGQQTPQAKSMADVQLSSLSVLWSLAWVLQPEAVTAEAAVPGTVVAERPPGSPPIYLVHQVFRL